jgi:hypothetical protein
VFPHVNETADTSIISEARDRGKGVRTEYASGMAGINIQARRHSALRRLVKKTIIKPGYHHFSRIPHQQNNYSMNQITGGNMAGALEGIKVLDFTQAFAGPFCTLLLRDLGAEIIKIERTVKDGGEGPRHNAPRTKAMESGTFIMLNRKFHPRRHGQARPRQPGAL